MSGAPARGRLARGRRQRGAAGAALALAIGLGAIAAAAAPAAAAARSELVRVPLDAYDGSLTPYSFSRAYGLLALVYDTLLSRDREGVPRPWLARSVRPDRSGRRLTVRLARGARWHDGTALTASDVAFTLERMRRVHHPRFTPQLRALEGISVSGRHRLVLRLRHPAPGFMDQPLADVPILPRHLWEGLPPGAVPRGPAVGSGPYRLTRADPRRGYRLDAFAAHFRGRPAVRRIELPLVTGERALTRAFARRRVDLVRVKAIAGPTGLLESEAVGLARGSGYTGTALVLNVRREPFDDARLRRALAAALEPARIARAAAGSGNPIDPATRGMLHPRSRWALRADLRPPRPPSAAALAGLRGRPLGVLADAGDEQAVRAARAVAATLRGLGADARARPRARAALERAVGVDGARARFELAVWPTPPLASHDPDGLRAMFAADGELNYSGYRSAAFERLAARVARARPAGARRAAVAEQLRLLARDAPVVPLFFAVETYVYRRAAWDGWVFVRGGGVLDRRSFEAGRTAPRPPPRPPRDAIAIGAPGLVAIALLALALALVAVGSWRARGAAS